MNKVASGDISCGMRFSSPVFFDDGKNMFLAEGKSVKSYHVAALKRWGIPFVLTNGHEMKGDELSRYMVRAKRMATLQAIASVPAQHKSGVPVNMGDTADVTDLFADDIASSGGGADDARAPAVLGATKTVSAVDNGKPHQPLPKLDAEDVTTMFV